MNIKRGGGLVKKNEDRAYMNWFFNVLENSLKETDFNRRGIMSRCRIKNQNAQHSEFYLITNRVAGGYHCLEDLDKVLKKGSADFAMNTSF